MQLDGNASRRIVVIDDQEVIRKTIAAILEKGGWEADTFEDIESADAFIARAEGDLTGILIDATVDGGDINRRLRRYASLSPRPMILIMSGYLREQVMDKISPELYDVFLEKPFRAAKLLETLDQLLKDRSP